MSANRKYTQLILEDIERLLSVFVDVRNSAGPDEQDFRIGHALSELITIARAARPGSSICLAYAVKRGVK